MSNGYCVLLRDNDTGEERVYQHASPWGEATKYLWTEGNYSCDCNRRIFFAEAGGDELSDDRACGMGRYAALWAELPNGDRIELEDVSDAGGNHNSRSSA